MFIELYFIKAQFSDKHHYTEVKGCDNSHTIPTENVRHWLWYAKSKACVWSMYVSVYVLACMCLSRCTQRCLQGQERATVLPFCFEEVHQLGTGFIWGGVLCMKDGMEKKRNASTDV